MTKQAFINHIFDKNYLWSFDKNHKGQIPDSILIEHTLLYGDVFELKQLFLLFTRNTIEQIWLEKLVPQSRYKKLNTYLATFFFQYSNSQEFINQNLIEYPRLKRFKLLTSQD